MSEAIPLQDDTAPLDEQPGAPIITMALVQLQKDLKHAELDAENPHFQSKYATLKSVIDAVRPALFQNGLTFQQKSEPVEGGVQVTTTLYHLSGEFMEGGPVFIPTDKSNAHGYGSALSYARRYSLALTCGISADTDDDANYSTTDLVEYNQHVRELWDSVVAIKDGIRQGEEDDLKMACEAWSELTNSQKQSIWLAPTKGGIFTTEERRVIKEVLPKYLQRGNA